MDIVRAGRICSVNYEKGTARVTYQDRDNMVTSEMPLLCFGYIYFMPKVDDPVMVLHLDNGSEAGLILGRYYCNDNRPIEPAKDFFRIELERNKQAFLRHKEGEVTELYAINGVLVTATDKGVKVECSKGGYTLIATEGGVKIDATQGGVQIQGNVQIQGALTVSNIITGMGGMAVSGGNGASVSGSITQTNGDFKTTGNVNANADVTAGSISLQNHTHSGVQAGGSNTSTPN